MNDTAIGPLINAERADAVLEELGLDALVLTSAENVAYGSGYYCMSHWTNKGTLAACILVRGRVDEPVVIVPAIEVDAWAVSRLPGELVGYGTSAHTMGRVIGRPADSLDLADQSIASLAVFDKPLDKFMTIVGDVLPRLLSSKATVALDESGLSSNTASALRATLPAASWAEGTSVARRIRRVKSPREIELLHRSAEITCAAIDESRRLIAPGVEERSLLRRFHEVVVNHDARLSFALIHAGTRSGRLHTDSSSDRLRPGDVVKYDAGCCFGLYHSDVARFYTVGDASTEVSTIHHALVRGLETGVEMTRPGALPSEIFEAVVTAVRDNGIPGYRRHHVGHGVGIEMYDPPLLQPADSASELSGLGAGDDPLEEGMVVNIEAPYYVLGRFGMNMEDTLEVTATGNRVLSPLDRELEIPGYEDVVPQEFSDI